MCGVSLIFQILCCLRLVSIPTLQLYNDTMVDTMASCEALFLLSKSVATHTEHTIYHKLVTSSCLVPSWVDFTPDLDFNHMSCKKGS